MDLVQPSAEVKFRTVNVSTTIEVGDRAVPTLLNAISGAVLNVLGRLKLVKPSTQRFTILKDINGMLKPVCPRVQT